MILSGIALLHALFTLYDLVKGEPTVYIKLSISLCLLLGLWVLDCWNARYAKPLGKD